MLLVAVVGIVAAIAADAVVVGVAGVTDVAGAAGVADIGRGLLSAASRFLAGGSTSSASGCSVSTSMVSVESLAVRAWLNVMTGGLNLSMTIITANLATFSSF